MRLADLAQKIKQKAWHSPDLPKDVFILLFICLVGVGAFLLGKMVSMEEGRKGELRIVQTDTSKMGEGGVPPIGNAASSTTKNGSSRNVSATTSVHGAYVGSRNGTTYYLPWCGGVKLIHEENKVWFASKEDAEAKGYKPAGNCKGI